MHGIVKLLVAAACLCVLGWSAHWGYKLYEESQSDERARAAAISASQAQSSAALEELRAECDKRVPSQTTDSLKQLHRDCLVQQAPLYGVDPNGL